MCVRARNGIQWAHKSIAFAIYLPDLNKNRKEINRFSEVLLSIQIQIRWRAHAHICTNTFHQQRLSSFYFFLSLHGLFIFFSSAKLIHFFSSSPSISFGYSSLEIPSQNAIRGMCLRSRTCTRNMDFVSAKIKAHVMLWLGRRW